VSAPGNFKIPASLDDQTLAAGGTEAGNFGLLSQLAMDAIQGSDINRLQIPANCWLDGDACNQPVRSNQAFGCEIRRWDSREAKSRWLSIVGRGPPPAPPFGPQPADPSGPRRVSSLGGA